MPTLNVFAGAAGLGTGVLLGLCAAALYKVELRPQLLDLAQGAGIVAVLYLELTFLSFMPSVSMTP